MTDGRHRHDRRRHCRRARGPERRKGATMTAHDLDASIRRLYDMERGASGGGHRLQGAGRDGDDGGGGRRPVVGDVGLHDGPDRGPVNPRRQDRGGEQ